MDYTPKHPFAADHDNVHPRFATHPLLKRVCKYPYILAEYIAAIALYTLGARAAETTRPIAFTTLLTILLTIPIALLLTGAQTTQTYIETGTLTVTTLTVHDVTHIIEATGYTFDPAHTPILIGAYVFTAYTIGTLLFAPWDEFSPGIYSYSNDYVTAYETKHVANPRDRLLTTAGILTSLGLTALLYTTFTADHGLIATIILPIIAITGYLLAFVLIPFLVFPTWVKLVPIALIIASPFALPLSFTELGILYLTGLTVLYVCRTFPITQLGYDWDNPNKHFYRRSAWIIGTWGISIAVTISGLLGGPIQLTVAGYVTAQLVTIAFFTYRRVGVRTVEKSRLRNSIADVYGTVTESVREQEQRELMEEWKEAVFTDEVKEEVGGILAPSARDTIDDVLAEDINYAIEEFNEAAEPYLPSDNQGDAMTVSALQPETVEEINEITGEIQADETKPVRVRQAAARVERVTDQALNDM